ncbi:MAG: arginyltransferase [Gammaproteobacteria bacterium]|nr:arginyltransferase [Gammaproteobacteria bacterium]
MTRKADSLGFYATPEHDCSYLPGQKAITLFADPNYPKNRKLYSALASIGFRRSGEHVYQPYCKDCSACVPIRIPVHDFRPSRNQKRNWKRNRDLTCTIRNAEFSPEHFQLYKKYISSRHPGGGMDNPSEAGYMEFLTASWTDSRFIEFRHGTQLVAVAVIDVMENALSAVYTWFDPEQSDRSPGRYSVLYEIELARQYGYSWLYLGYWINQCDKMKYKNEYRPHEYYINNEWVRSSDKNP